MNLSSVTQTGQALPAAPDNAEVNWLAENKELIKTVKSIDASGLFGEGNELTFARDQDTKQPVIRLVDQRTNQVLWQVPPEYLLRMAEVLGPHDGLHG